MAKIIKRNLNNEKNFWTIELLQVEVEEKVKVICKSSCTDKTKLKVYFDLEKKKNYTMYTIADCIETIRDDYVSIGYISLEFEFYGKTMEFYMYREENEPSVLEQMAKTVFY